MGKRMPIYLGLLGATLALAALGFAKLGASLSDWPGGGWLWREITGEPNSASGLRTGEDWIHFDWTTFVDTQGNLVSAGQVYVALGLRQVERQPISVNSYVGILCKIVVPGWQSILQGRIGQTLAVQFHWLWWVDVSHTGVGAQQH